MTTPDEDRCACGRPLHYSNPDIERYMRELVARYGSDVRVQVDGEDYGVWVPRHYIALHGITGATLTTLAAMYGWRADVE